MQRQIENSLQGIKFKSWCEPGPNSTILLLPLSSRPCAIHPCSAPTPYSISNCFWLLHHFSWDFWVFLIFDKGTFLKCLLRLTRACAQALWVQVIQLKHIQITFIKVTNSKTNCKYWGHKRNLINLLRNLYITLKMVQIHVSS